MNRTTDIIVIAAYLFGTVVFGCSFYFRRKKRDGAHHFMTGGGRLPTWALSLSVFATYISSISFLAMPEGAYDRNWWGWVNALTVPIATLVAVKWFVPFYRRTVGVSAYSFLEKRFGTWARIYASACFLVMQSARSGIILLLLAILVNQLLGFSYESIILVTGLATLIYSVMGGLSAVVWTDAIQALVLIVGTFVCVLCLFFFSPDLATHAVAAWDAGKFSLGSMSLTDWSSNTFWVLFLYGICLNLQNFGVDQCYTQRYVAAKDERAACRSIWTSALIYVPVALLFSAIGTLLWIYNRANPDVIPTGLRAAEVFPWFIMNKLPMGVSGLLVAAILAAAMSTVSSTLNSGSTVLLEDYWKRFCPNGATERGNIIFLRTATVFLSFVSIAIALAVVWIWGKDNGTILGMWYAIQGVLSGGMLGLFLIGAFSRRTRAVHALVATICGFATLVWIVFGQKWMVISHPLHVNLSIVLATLTIVVVGFTLSCLSQNRNRFLFLLMGCVLPTVALTAEKKTEGAFKRLSYNNARTTFVKAGLFSSPLVMDYDGDGDLDVIINSWGIPTWSGTWLFENTGKKGECNPVFKPARKLPRGGDQAQVLSDGRLAVLEPGRVAYDYRENGMKNAQPFKGLPENVHSNVVRGNVWRFADLDGDGKEDLVVGVGDWKGYGWHDAWDVAGVWTNDVLHGYIYFIKNCAGVNGDEAWGVPEVVRLADGRPIDVKGHASPLFADWDGDGDLDLLTCDFIDNYTYFQNIGTKTNPRFAAGRPILDKSLKPIKADLCMVTATVADWDGDGFPDFITCEEDARVCLIRNTGRVAMGVPVFEAPQYFRQERAEVHFGILVTPAVVDWDGDGDEDILTGNSAGYVAFIENLSGPKVAAPKWAEPKLLEADGAPIRIIAGPNGSIQGPAEEKWGYTCLSVGDWDGDGLPDVMLNSIRGEILWCRNIGTRTAPKLAPPAPVAAEWEDAQPELDWGWLKPFGSKNILTQWRTTPYMIDLDEDGLMDLVMLDTEGFLCLWRRARKGDKLVLLPPERCLCDEKGEPLLLAGRDTHAGPGSARAGGSGRRKFCFADWTGDGKKDLIVNSRNVALYEFVGKKNGKWHFAARGDLDDAHLAGHTTSPTACDFDGDGKEDLLVGAEDGFFYLLDNNR